MSLILPKTVKASEWEWLLVFIDSCTKDRTFASFNAHRARTVAEAATIVMRERDARWEICRHDFIQSDRPAVVHITGWNHTENQFSVEGAQGGALFQREIRFVDLVTYYRPLLQGEDSNPPPFVAPKPKLLSHEEALQWLGSNEASLTAAFSASGGTLVALYAVKLPKCGARKARTFAYATTIQAAVSHAAHEVTEASAEKPPKL